MNTAVSVNLTVEIDLAQWADDFNLGSLSEAREDVRRCAQIVVQDQLRENLGYHGASVRINNAPRMARFRQ